jgi:endonuclease-3
MRTKRSKKSSKPKSSAREPAPSRLKRAKQILAGLKTLYPDADCALHHSSPLQLLVATILSAQSTDANVNKVTPGLFERYPDARALAGADAADLEREVHSTGFFRQKTKSIQGACRRIIEVYGGRVPDTMEDLVTLPGVARKTANVILGTWFKKNEGIVVDTHVGRLAHRLGLTWSSKGEKDAVRIEGDLLRLIPRNDWTFFGHAMILHGRRICSAKKPDCAACLLSNACPSAFTFGAAQPKKTREDGAQEEKTAGKKQPK